VLSSSPGFGLCGKEKLNMVLAPPLGIKIIELEGMFSIIKVKGRLTPYPFDPPAVFYF